MTLNKVLTALVVEEEGDEVLTTLADFVGPDYDEGACVEEEGGEP
jgi:hypothetical protein